MHRWTLLTLLLVASACKDGDPTEPMTSASLPTQPGGTTDGPVTTSQADSSDTPASTSSGDASTGSSGPGVSGTDTSATSLTSASNPTIPDPSAGPDPTETAFIVPMTDPGDPSGPTGDPTGNPTSDPTGDPSGGGEYGQCGWSAGNNYYDCASAGGTPGAVDPSGIDPIDCPDGLMEGAPCDEQSGPVKNVGCCDPGGTLYYCTSQGSTIVKEECGA
jgi:hypothetical protein